MHSTGAIQLEEERRSAAAAASRRPAPVPVVVGVAKLARHRGRGGGVVALRWHGTAGRRAGLTGAAGRTGAGRADA